MSLYPENIETKLGFDSIREMLQQKCVSTMGVEYVHKMKFSVDSKKITKLLTQTKEFIEIINTALVFPTDHYIPVKTYIQKAEIDGAYLSEFEFHDLRNMLATINKILYFFKGKESQFPELYKITQGMESFSNLVNAINLKIDANGQMKPNASKLLQDISSKISSNENLVRKRINAIAKSIIENQWGPETTITIRNDRLVVAIYPEFKRKISGIVHDESATGQTLYIEPNEIFELNNHTLELHHERRQEIRQILIELTRIVMPHVSQISVCCDKLGMFDFIRSKALLSIDLKSNIPDLSATPSIKLVQARHPLLYISYKKQKKNIIPLTLELNRNQRIVVISGPNAGGKSVLLKTVGLLQYMFQCGLPIPCKDGTTLGIYHQIFIDIGDQQSIENDLSTYSSHLLNMKYFSTFSNSKTLFLIDEFGTGTDPQLGGPMAEALLENLNTKFAFGIITTHFSNLKILAQSLPGVYNGSMLYNNKELQPLYQFEPGVPGSSYTFEIAQKIGLDAKIINQAKNKVGNKQNHIEKLIIELERERTYIQNLKKDLQKDIEQSISNKVKYDTLFEELQLKKRELLAQSKSEAAQLIKNAKKEIENTIRNIKESNADVQITKTVRKNLEVLQESLLENEEIQSQAQLNNDQIKKGSWVKLIDNDNIGEVLNIQKNKVELMLGNIKSLVDINKVTLVQKPLSNQVIYKKTTAGIDLNEKLAHFNAEINVIGKRGEEAITEVLQFIDEAIMLNFHQVRIVHGRGAGILKRVIRNELKKINSIKSLKNESEEFGGDAITLVEFK